MKNIKILFLSLLLSWSLLSGFDAYTQPISIEGEFTNCDSDSLTFYGVDGTLLKPLTVIPLTPNAGTFTFNLSFDKLPEGMYIIGKTPPQSPKSFLIHAGTQIKLTGNCNDIQSATIWQSPLNNEWSEIQQMLKKIQVDTRQLTQAYYRASDDQLGTITQQLSENDQQQLRLLDSLRKSNSLLASLAAPYIYLSYANNGEKYKDELDYFAQSFFAQTNLADPVYNRVPTLFQAFQNYAYTLGAQIPDVSLLTNYADNWLNSIPQPSPAHATSLSGLIAGLRQRNPDAFAHYASQYIKLYPSRNPQETQQLQQELQSIQAQLIGSIAPEISLPNPEGDTINLSDLKGKVVLIDFWASWCRPCRLENPNVVKLYNKYKDQGFEILGVSLDRDKTSWTRAIQQDKLDWLHISDLKYFRSVAAQTYGVNAIPYTVLVDADGRIIAKKLRGRQLERKLEEIFGS